jgi:hypothetical protein
MRKGGIFILQAKGKGRPWHKCIGVSFNAIKIGNKIKGHFGMFEVKLTSVYITSQGRLFYWLVSLIHIGPTTPMIKSLLQFMFLALVQDL